MPTFEFHVSRHARDRYAFEDRLFALSGNVLLANFHAARLFAQKMNAARDLANHPERAVRAGQINAMGLIDELSHLVVAQYRAQVNPAAMTNALAWLERDLGQAAVDDALLQFAREFPSVEVYRGGMDAATFLDSVTDGVPHRQIVLEEMLMLWLENRNPAFAPFRELFDDTALEKFTAYKSLLSSLYVFFDTQPRFGPDEQNLIDLLRAPALAAPDSLEAQLEFIRTRWFALIGEHLHRLLSSLDLIKEETKLFFAGPGEAHVPTFKPGATVDARARFADAYGEAYPEYERFSRDLEWMPRLVLIAKSTYVWLDQLSQKYQRVITRLDQIPDEELDLLARRGFTGLWLIGVWQRSRASQRIKELSGNLIQEASAYSVDEYRIADDLGGDAALENLKARAWRRGVRIASDMVPNHMGIDSRWVIEHPDWFIASDYAPFPAYTFNGANLSPDPRVGIFLEDHYFNRSDAAVVFKHVDYASGSVRYIYHGNDGTSFPWNDTAQLNFLQAQVREAVIQTILHVARQFPIIRLDAAMTLAKRHYQRLWFPQPGTGGDIPSRSDFGLTKEEFDAAMPEEFWREVVDRVAADAPDTLLLAEAFWLMEGYFVRTLGMHRVYNSAFMNMLRDEQNAKYRSVIKNTIEFDPEILKRYVNFINNPDERTAVDQFGKGDKYFCVCTLMATMPGLPMFGHGQIEGLAERYGMEFRRAMWAEQADEHLVWRHEREIFPLLHRRNLFAGVENFLLYDFFTADGAVCEDVFAYSNRAGGERALVIVHNQYANVAGWIRMSAAYLDKASGALTQQTLDAGLALTAAEDSFVIWRDQISGLEFIRPSQELRAQGLYVELGAYARHVLLDFRETRDDDQQRYARLCAALNGHGVPSVDEAVRELYLQPVHLPFRDLVNATTFRALLAARAPTRTPRTRRAAHSTAAQVLDDLSQKYLTLARAAKRFSGGVGDEIAMALQLRRDLAAVLQLPATRANKLAKDARALNAALKFTRAQLTGEAQWATLFGWALVRNLGAAQDERQVAARSRAWLDEWMLGKLIASALRDFGLREEQVNQAVAMIAILTTHQAWHLARAKRTSQAALLFDEWLEDPEAARFLQVNRFGGIEWFNKEAFETLAGWMGVIATAQLSARITPRTKKPGAEIVAAHHALRALHKAEHKSQYQVDKVRAKV